MLTPKMKAERMVAATAIIFLALILIIMVFSGFFSLLNGYYDRSEVMIQETKDNFILGMVVLSILGTFGMIAYYYRTIDFRSKK